TLLERAVGLAADLVRIDHDRREVEAGGVAGPEKSGRARLEGTGVPPANPGPRGGRREPAPVWEACPGRTPPPRVSLAPIRARGYARRDPRSSVPSGCPPVVDWSSSRMTPWCAADRTAVAGRTARAPSSLRPGRHLR